jgi:uncharacterized protein Yka (UPF0111/DUF47 family)
MQMTEEQFQVTIVKIYNKIDKLQESVDALQKMMEETNKNLYSPDSGVYSRIKENENKIEALNRFQKGITTYGLFLLTTTTGLIIKSVFDLIGG